MRKSLIVTVALIALSFQGCIVKSVHQFYKEKDVFLRPTIEGTWEDKEKVQWTIHRNPFGKNYELHCSKNGREVALLGTLFELDGNTYLDIIPTQDNSEEVLVFDLHMVPTHSIARINIAGNDEINIFWFNEEWLREMFTQNKIRISHELVMDADPKSKDDGLYLLTATTDELQKFVMKYGNDERAYDENDLSLELKRIN
ncbi:MAG TPA: hypothetical protein VFE50_21590 [Cyclobacteriaceae bacterium]|nr:hypothetical protein [Cyclobacteriaceae bacterium]